MKKFLLIPTTIVTALLALAFVSPGAASGAAHAIAPAVNFVGLSHVLAPAATTGQQASTAIDSGSSGTSSQDTATRASSSSPGMSTQPGSTTDQAPPPVGFSIATPGQENCGRFGNGFHGGKHLFVCPNRPFPPPPNQ